ncbi:MAG TPA: hypothetical protein VIK13_06010 [Candidatus Limnocylindrales bacterium]
MLKRLTVGALALALTATGCGGLTDSPAPGASMEKMCEAAQALASAVILARGSAAASEGGDGAAAANLAEHANTRRQDGMALAGWAGALEGSQDPPTPGFAERMAEVRAAQQAVDLVIGVLGSAAAPVSVEARPRLLDAAETSVRAISLPERCTVAETPPPSS